MIAHDMMRKSAFFFLFLHSLNLTAGSACGAEATKDYGSAAPVSGGGNADVIGPQDVIQIKTFGEAGVKTYRVDKLGYITHPLAGRVKIAGKTAMEAENLLESLMEDGGYIINPQVTIFVPER